ncbi:MULTISPECIES: hypothetical protein [unclassified Haematobacter]|uniref:hypothetical protein n=1 Tax=unclassified Haematobacter TaxID=2640585 RepID=UPI0025BCA5E9|nr:MULTISPECIES: hypothetical protein [unclassified Haematobacter]
MFLAIETDVFFSERSLYGDRWIDSALARLQSEGLVHKGALEPPKGKRPDGWKPRERPRSARPSHEAARRWMP